MDSHTDHDQQHKKTGSSEVVQNCWKYIETLAHFWGCCPVFTPTQQSYHYKHRQQMKSNTRNILAHIDHNTQTLTRASDTDGIY